MKPTLVVLYLLAAGTAAASSSSATSSKAAEPTRVSAPARQTAPTPARESAPARSTAPARRAAPVERSSAPDRPHPVAATPASSDRLTLPTGPRPAPASTSTVIVVNPSPWDYPYPYPYYPPDPSYPVPVRARISYRGSLVEPLSNGLLLASTRAEVIRRLGQPLREADGILTYSGLVARFDPQRGVLRSVTLTGSNVKLHCGVGPGSSRDDVERRFGPDASVAVEEYHLNFAYGPDGRVQSITITPLDSAHDFMPH